jgi:predicted DNA-binding transcriptional regulator AlpA
MESKELKKLFSRQRRLMKAALVINEKLSEIQQMINTLMLSKISSVTQIEIVDNDLMTEKEVCDWISKSKATLYRMRTYHNFPHSKIPGQKAIIYSRKAIEAYIKENNIYRHK